MGLAFEQSTTDKPHAVKNCIYSSKQVAPGFGFQNVAAGIQANRFLNHIRRRFLTQENYFRSRGKFANLPSSLNTAQSGKADVQQNQVRFEFERPLNCFESVRDFANDLQVRPIRQRLANKLAKGCKILYNQNANRAHAAPPLLQVYF